MNDEIRLKFLITVSIICFAALVAQSFYIYRSSAASDSLASNQEEIPKSIEKRLAKHMAKPDRVMDLPMSSSFGFNSGLDPFQQMQKQIDQMFSSFGGGASGNLGIGLSGFGTASMLSQPKVELEETADHYIVSLDVAEGENVQLDTSIEDNLLKITGTIETEKFDTSAGRSLSSSSRSQFSQAIPLNAEIDELGITTTHGDDGIIVKVPKKIS